MREKAYVIPILYVILVLVLLCTQSIQAMKVNAGDLAPDGSFVLNSQKIAYEISTLTSDEIKEYPFTSLSADDIESVFGFLDQDELARLLLNIPLADLVEITSIIDPRVFAQALSELTEGEKTLVIYRLNSALP